uniref:Uncharacterized protein n=1 Tax=Solanum lycopersicum TaxID=4081 RepID=A0A3Q7GL68_SOLLC
MQSYLEAVLVVSNNLDNCKYMIQSILFLLVRYGAISYTLHLGYPLVNILEEKVSCRKRWPVLARAQCLKDFFELNRHKHRFGIMHNTQGQLFVASLFTLDI